MSDTVILDFDLFHIRDITYFGLKMQCISLQGKEAKSTIENDKLIAFLVLNFWRFASNRQFENHGNAQMSVLLAKRCEYKQKELDFY